MSIVEAAKQGWLSNQLWYVDNNSGNYRYDVAGIGRIMTIDPWQGYWIFAKEDVNLIIPPFEGKKLDGTNTYKALASTQSVQTLAMAETNAVWLTGTGDLVDDQGWPVGSCGLEWDIARSMTAWQKGYLVLDGFGGLHALGGSDEAASFDFGFDIARRVVSEENHYYVLDGFGTVHAGANSTPLPQAVHFESDLARDIELVNRNADAGLPVVPPPPGSPLPEIQLDYYLLDAYGRVYPMGDLPELGYPELDEPVAKDMALTPDGKGYYVVDAYGHVYGFGSAQVFEEETPVFAQSRIERIIAVNGGYYLLDCLGQVYAAGAAKEKPLGMDLGLDIVRDVIIN